ncbi:dihydroxyacetone kinase 1 [[Candida] anglica]|uniref:Dihydroxyacetone kinase 1 n=1 Tax=[Candida] anglica TaxID=148631 RepID=A0ABP0ED88_9ASCO
MGKHWGYDKNEDLVLSNLKALVRSNPAVRLIPDEKVVYNPNTTAADKVTIISGGGAGHEPLHAAYVGENILDGAVSGAIFASPSTKQIMAAIRKCTNTKKNGTLIVVKNYTGDILHFGLVVERAKAEGYTVEMLAVADDVAVGREQNKMVGRRGLAGTALVHKCVGAASTAGASLESIVDLGRAINENLVTLGASLDRTSVPGKQGGHDDDEDEEEHTGPNEAELGLGIHNEPGHRLKPIPKIDDLLKDMFEKLLSPKDTDRHYVDFDHENDDYVLLINNIGGTSTLELYVIAEHVIQTIPLKRKPTRILISDFVTSLSAPGFSVTLLNLTKAGGKAKDFSSEDIVSFLDKPTDAPGWKPKSYDSKLWESSAGDSSFDEKSPMANHDPTVTSSLEVDPKVFESAIKASLSKLLEMEPKITHYDTQVGDGDCGETLAAGANSILSCLEKGELQLKDPVATLSKITELVEDSMGGTSGGIYSIFLTALVKNLQKAESVTALTLGEAFHGALYDGLFKYTKARVGGRTLVDTLQPFVDSLKEHGDLSKAVQEAKRGCDSTTDLQAKFGRASYVSDEEFKDKDGGIPDPGAVGLLAMIEGFAEGLK